MSDSLDESVGAAGERLDAHTRDMVQWHFDPATGCDFWLEYAARLDFDPREAVGGYGDLEKLGHFEDEWLRGGPVRRWVPKAYANDPVYVFETGGSTGIPKSPHQHSRLCHRLRAVCRFAVGRRLSKRR